MILSGCATRPIAASVCNSYDGGDYDDWFLPSKDELYALYENREAIGGFPADGGGMPPPPPIRYVSSTEISSDQFWSYIFNLGSESEATKGSGNRVRCIRSF